MTVREFFASGRKGGFAQQLLRTYDDPCDGNWRLLRAVADGRNFRLVDEAEWGDGREEVRVDSALHQERLRSRFPMLGELDRELTGVDYSRLPREAANANRTEG